MINPIAFLLGAGASQPYHVPTMTIFYNAFRDHLRTRYPRHFALLEQFESTGRHSSPDLETLLSDLQLAASARDSLQLLGASVSEGMSYRLLKFSGGPRDDYAT